MPAVTVDDLSKLPTIPVPDRAASGRTARQVRDHRPERARGEGCPVRRAFAGLSLADLDPFVHMDQMGAVDYAPGEPKGTPWHPLGASRR